MSPFTLRQFRKHHAKNIIVRLFLSAGEQMRSKKIEIGKHFSIIPAIAAW